MFGASLESEQSRGYHPGHVLAKRYELRRLLGEGGTGVVWAAEDRVLNLEVAVKLVRQGEASDDFARRARIEASSAARIAHPAVCRAIDFGLSAYGEPFIVSELLVGESLDDAIERQGRLEATHAVRLLLPILDALRAAHEAGIVHRDVKPANIFLACDGLQRLQPKLLDFGIACRLDDPGSMSDAGICGTPEFMSPEQARGEDIDGRSDLWNFCATLYEALTGVVPFREASPAAVLCAIQTVAPDPITTFGAGDERLSGILLRGMSRERQDRWQSAHELAHQLCLWLLDQEIETDICDHSLRARLLGSTGPDSGRDSPYTHVLPGNDRRERAGGDGEGAVSSGARPRRWKRVWVAAAAGAALVAATSSFQALRAADQRRAHTLAPAGSPLPQTTTGEAPTAAPRAPSSTRTGSIGVVESAVADAQLPPRREPAIAGVPTRMPRVIATTSEGASTLGVPSPPLPRQRARNALNYDFGF